MQTTQSAAPDTAFLANLEPLSQLTSTANLKQLLDKSQLLDLGWREKLQQANEHHWLVYLLSGEVELSDGHGSEVTVSANSKRARQPLFRQSVVSLTVKHRSQVLRVDREMVELLLAKEQQAQTEVAEVELSSLDSQILMDIYQAHAAGELRVPSLPDIAIKVRRAVAREDCGVNDVATIVQADPVIAGRLLQVANSAAYGGLQGARSVLEAINRLGLNATRNLVMALAVRDLFDVRSGALKHLATQTYRHSAQVAAMCCTLARDLKVGPPDQAMLVGLFHDIGTLPVLEYADAHPELQNDARAIAMAIGRLRGTVGALVLAQWNCDATLIYAAEHAEDWHRDSGEALDLCDLVIVSQLQLAHMAGDTRMPALIDTPVGRKAGADQNGLPADMVERTAQSMTAMRDLLLRT